MRRKLIPPEQLDPGVIEIAIDLFKSTGFLIINKTVIKKIGLLEAAVLSNYVDKYQYFKNKTEEFDGWFFLKHEDVMEQLNLSERTVRRIKTKLIASGFIKTKLASLPTKEWIWINFKNLITHCFSSTLTNLGGLSLAVQGGLLYKDNKVKEYTMLNQRKKDLEGVLVPSDFTKFWELYPSKRRGLKGKALTAFEKICKPTFAHRPTWQRVRAAVLRQLESEAWKEQLKTSKAIFIPLAATWLNGKRWLDDASELKVHRFNDNGKSNSHENDSVKGGWIGNKFAQ